METIPRRLEAKPLDATELKRRLERPKNATLFAHALLDTAIRETIALGGRLEELKATVQVADCGHKAFPIPPDEGVADGCTAMSITINGETRVFCECQGIAEGAY